VNTAELALSQQSSPLRPSLACRGTHTDDDDVLPLNPEQPPTAVKAEVRTERPEATRVSVLGLKKGSLIVNDAGAVAKVERVLRSGDDVHLRVRNEHGQLGKLTVAPDKHFLQLPAGAELVAAPEQAGPVLELAHNPHDGPSLS
jgi:hypothetical protein